MTDKVIWSDDRSMNFLASEYAAASITYPNCPADKEMHWVQVHLKGSSPSGRMHRHAGLQYATCKSETEAKKCLVYLIEKLVRCGVIEETEAQGSNRFDHVELQEK